MLKWLGEGALTGGKNLKEQTWSTKKNQNLKFIQLGKETRTAKQEEVDKWFGVRNDQRLPSLPGGKIAGKTGSGGGVRRKRAHGEKT